MGPAADERHGRVASPDAEHDPSVRFRLQRRGGAGNHGGMPRDRVGHARAEQKTLRGADDKRKLDEDLGLQVLTVGEEQPVPPIGLGLDGEPPRLARKRKGVKEELHRMRS